MQLSCNCCTKAEYFQVCYFLKNDKTLVSSQGTGRELLLQNCSRRGAAFVQRRALLLLKEEDAYTKSGISRREAGWGSESRDQTPLPSAGESQAASASVCSGRRSLRGHGARAAPQRQPTARGTGRNVAAAASRRAKEGGQECPRCPLTPAPHPRATVLPSPRLPPPRTLHPAVPLLLCDLPPFPCGRPSIAVAAWKKAQRGDAARRGGTAGSRGACGRVTRTAQDSGKPQRRARAVSRRGCDQSFPGGALAAFGAAKSLLFPEHKRDGFCGYLFARGFLPAAAHVSAQY